MWFNSIYFIPPASYTFSGEKIETKSDAFTFSGEPVKTK